MTPEASAFLDSLPARPEAVDLGRLQTVLAAQLDAAGAAHPDLPLDREALARFVAARVTAGADPVAILAQLPIGDLHLAERCLRGDRTAMERLDREVLRPASLAAARVDSQRSFIEDVHQRLRERLLVSDGTAPPRLATFTGGGSLVGWCKVAALRIALNLKAPAGHEECFDPEALQAQAEITGLETQAVRARYSDAVKKALQDATATLSQEDRLLLRYQYVDGLSLEQIARIYQTHRSTISRRAATARVALLREVRRLLRRRLGADSGEVSSLLRVLRSGFDLEVSALLRTPV